MASVLIQINCGYARTAIRELIMSSKTKHHGVIHRHEFEREFFKLFDKPTYKIPFGRRDTHDKRWSKFDKQSDGIYKHFNRKWHPVYRRDWNMYAHSLQKTGKA